MSKGAYAKGTLPGLNELFRRDEMSDTVNKELVEAIEAIEEEMCDDFSPRAQRINEQISRIRELLGITLPDNEEGNECDWCGEMVSERSYPHNFDMAIGKRMCRGCWDHDREVYKGSYGEDIGEFKTVKEENE